MNTSPSETKRLADAVAGLAATMAEIMDARLQSLSGVMEQKVARKALQPLFDKRQAAEYFNVSVRTVENWMKRGFLPYYKIGYVIRIPMGEAEAVMQERCFGNRRWRNS